VKREAPISDKGDAGNVDDDDISFFGDLTANINKGVIKTQTEMVAPKDERRKTFVQESSPKDHFHVDFGGEP
jgi:hypothetical protein